MLLLRTCPLHVEQGKRHTNAVQVVSKGLSWDSVISLLEINKSGILFGSIAGAFSLRSMLKVSKNKHGLQSVAAWIEPKLYISDLLLSLTPTCYQISHRSTLVFSLYSVPLTADMR